MKIIGRKEEIKELESLYNSDNAELVAIYGRRRVGKTFLINELFGDRFTFKHTALSNFSEETNEKVTMEDQLEAFYLSLKKYGYSDNKKPKNWLEAFYLLELLLENKGKDRQLVFFDELPWLDTPKSKFISAFERFYNGWANSRNIMIIICGSANSWITNKLINNYGGLYNRVTREIKLLPFSLSECEEYYKEKNIILSRYDIVQSYMVFGGVPYYMGYIKPDLSLPQNIDNIFFKKNSVLNNEFKKLFSSIFKNPELATNIVKTLANNRVGLSRKDIVDKLKTNDGEMIAESINALCEGDFVMKYRPLLDDKKTLYYKLIDPFCIFYLKFVENANNLDERLFTNNMKQQSIVSWRGLAFENVCFNHIRLIKRALNVEGVSSNNYPFIYKNDDDKGTQIDLVIERVDNVVNLCEIKFYSDLYEMKKDDHFDLVRKSSVLSSHLSKKQVIRNILISTFGIKRNEYSFDYQTVITLDELFDR